VGWWNTERCRHQGAQEYETSVRGAAGGQKTIGYFLRAGAFGKVPGGLRACVPVAEKGGARIAELVKAPGGGGAEGPPWGKTGGPANRVRDFRGGFRGGGGKNFSDRGGSELL